MQPKNVVIKKNCHSRGMLSGIYNVLSHHLKRIIPEFISGSSTPAVTQQQALKTLKRVQGLSNFITTRGFTLIELLVVVLIIGILAAVAVPQYQKAVEKSRMIEGMMILKSVYAAAENYYLANGTFPTSFNQLAIDLPWTGTTYVVGSPSISNEEWSLEFYNNSNYNGLIITRIKGPYTGGQFQIWWKHQDKNIPTRTLLCGEQYSGTYTITKDTFCKKLFGSTKTLSSGISGGVYNLP